MNIENVKTLVGQLKRLPDEKFQMANWVDHDTPCGTVACIAGWCSILNKGPKEESRKILKFAMNFLGLEDTSLFYRSGWSDPAWDKAERPAAIAELERMIKAEHVSA